MSDIVADVFEAKFPERLEDLRALHATIVAHMPRQLEVSASGGMINYTVPFSVYPKGYHCSKNTRPRPSRTSGSTVSTKVECGALASSGRWKIAASSCRKVCPNSSTSGSLR